jgi:hypothetical protein
MAKVNWKDSLGAGISLFRDCSRNIKSSSGMERLNEAIYGRLVDTLWYAPDYGINLPSRIRRQNPYTWGVLASEVETELLKDDRIAYVNVDIEYDETSNLAKVYITGEAINGASFNMTTQVDLLTQESITFNAV